MMGQLLAAGPMSAYEKLLRLHDVLIEQVLADLEEGDVSARGIAVALLKNSNIQAMPAEDNLMGKLAEKLDFSAMQAKVTELRPRTAKAKNA